MGLSESEIVRSLHRRGRRVLLAGLSALNGLPAARAKPLRKLSAEAIHGALALAVLRFVVLALGRARGLFAVEEDYGEGRLFSAIDARIDVRASVRTGETVWSFPDALAELAGAFQVELEVGLRADGVDFATCPAEVVGNLYELLLGDAVLRGVDGRFELSPGKKRKQTGSFFTPRALTEVVVLRALEPLERRIRSSAHRSHDFVLDFRVCDPAVGGGAFLLEMARALAAHSGAHAGPERRRAIVTTTLHGVDINAVAVAVAEAALCLFVSDPKFALVDAGRNLRVGDALVGAPYGDGAPDSSHRLAGGSECAFDFIAQFPEVFDRGGFDLVIGNPPWVAYAGRAAQPLEPSRKAYLAAHYRSLKGYPTLHGLFVERSLQLAPQGTIALVVPSPIADLDGYRAVRREVRANHSPCEPMLEFGQDAFESVTQPCFALIAEASTGHAPRPDANSPFRLAERQRAGATAAEVLPPSALAEVAKRKALPRELFGEMGFQTTSIVTQHLLLRASTPDARHHYPLLEGRDVHEFAEGEPRLFLSPDPEALARARCRVRRKDDYERVRFVIRQTARYPIAALHRGLPFRNSLLAGFAVDGLPAELMVGLLNSSLYRALHLALRRDARQAAFPQVKIAHLRALPDPPRERLALAQIAGMAAELTRDGVAAAALAQLDDAVFSLFSLEPAQAREILDFLSARGALRR